MTSEAVETKSIITGLLTSTPLRCTMKQLCNDFRNTVGFNIPFRKLGYSTAEEYLRSIPDTVKIIGSGPSAEIKGVIKEKSAHINEMVARQRKDNIPVHKRKNIKRFAEVKGAAPSLTKSNTNNLSTTSGKQNSYNTVFFSTSIYEDEYKFKVPKKVQNNLRKLVMKFPDGIWCRRLPDLYRKMFQEELTYEKYNYKSLIEMCSDLQEIFHYIRPSSDDFILYDKNKAIPSLNQNEHQLNILNSSGNLNSPELDWALGSELIPLDVIQFLEEIPRCSLKDIKVGDYLNIHVGEIYNLDEFWIFPRSSTLDTLMDELQTVFHTRRNQYVIPHLFLEEGLYCIVRCKDEYHRCVITHLLPRSDLMEVLFIDYGAVGKVPTNELWYLPQQFRNPPCQAIKARLSYVRSIVDLTETISKFRQLIQNAELVAEVMLVDEKDSVLEIYLANITNSNNIFYVNDALVDKGYAEYCLSKD